MLYLVAVSFPLIAQPKMWRGADPVEDFDQLMCGFLWSLLDQQVGSIVADMKQSSLCVIQRLRCRKKGNPEALEPAHIIAD
jgi:hypothetical protein